jgi:shikimate dehydrogenase
MGIAGTYRAIRVPSGAYPTVLERLYAGDLHGVNVTMPHKDVAYATADRRSADANRTRAVNTVVVRDGRLHGSNTDVAGVRHAIATVRTGADRVVVLGTGGAARAALVAIVGPVAVMGRSSDRARMALEAAATPGGLLPWGSSVDGAVVVNATPIGMTGGGTSDDALPEAVLESASAIVDMVYGDHVTPTIRWAERAGIPHADGITMLVGQAVAAFEVFTGVPGPLDVMERAARG